MSMRSRGEGKAKSTKSRVLSDPMDTMSLGAAKTKPMGAAEGFACGGKMKKGGGIPFGKDYEGDVKKKRERLDSKAFKAPGARFAEGGLVKSSKAINGVAQKGLTKGKNV